MKIREATLRDREAIHSIHWSAFPEGERQVVAQLAVDLLAVETTPGTLALVADVAGVPVGHAAFSPVTAPGSENFRGFIVAPVAVRPALQAQGIGAALIERGIEVLTRMDVHVLFVYGDPGYYGRFGFRPETAERFIPPYRLQYPGGWQAMVLAEAGPIETPVEIACVAPLGNPVLW